MNKQIAKVIDFYALWNLHKEKSRVNHFKENGTSDITVNEISLTPILPDLKFNNGKFFYKSEIVDNGEKNSSVVGECYNVNGSLNDVSVIFVHGWRSSSLNRIKAIYHDSFLLKGYEMFYLTLPYHMEREPIESLYSGELMISANIERTITSVRQAVSDLRALIYWLKSRNKKVIIIGVSLGGYISNLTGAIESNIDALISIFAPGNLAHAIWYGGAGTYIKKEFEKNSITYEDLNEFWKSINVSNYSLKIDKNKSLLIKANYDKYIPNSDKEITWLNTIPDKIYKCGHSGIALCKRSILKDTDEFILKAIKQ